MIRKPKNRTKNSKPVNGSDRSFPSSLDVRKRKHSVNKSGESSNTNRGKGNIKDTNAQTAITEKDDVAIAIKVAAFVRKVLHNELPKEKMEWPLFLLIESRQSVKISQQDFQNMIINKSAEIMATKSYYAKQMDSISICEEKQQSYYEKYKQLLNHVSTLSAKLDRLNRMPPTAVKHVRSVGTNVNML
ncbi:uncharacterized protein LOC111040557 [Myzus persicae]|uniref:uncharacterized protein LOC111034823 n=1 Tax=Myzus persicae TaxID=13164 RepID=UPI000B93902E|nr:uncharacterized protein LOC111034823 [Myzus persicae]XP_022180183.1 uncharacterized protein LOC111040556 [Myzus persicae]XP_022180184.1 uncharacterized protein LOC111040557 [Myzus persicae]